MPSSKVIEAIAVTAELCGRTFSPAAAMVFATDLDGFSEQAVLTALSRCRKEVKGLLTVADVISRLDDGRPGAEEAWAMLPHDEATSTAWTTEMQQAWGVALPLIQDGDRVAARMAFKEAYTKLLAEARDKRIAPKWEMSFGHDVSGRQSALIEAVRHNRIGVNAAVALLPHDAAEGLLRSLGVQAHPLLAAPSRDGQRKVKALLASLQTKKVAA